MLNRGFLWNKKGVTGPIIVTCEYTSNGGIFISTDGGSTWEEYSGINSIFGTNSPRYSSVKNGTILIQPFGSSSYNVGAFSLNNGSSFSGAGINSSSSQCFGLSFNGKYLAIGSYGNDKIWLSSDYGSNWVTRSSVTDPLAIAISDDGNYAYYARYTDTEIRKSTDLFVNVSNAATPNASYNIQAIACSSNGAYVFTTPRNGGAKVWVSSNYAVSGSEETVDGGETAGYGAISCSSSGQYLLFSVNGKAYVSSNYGSTWTQKQSSISDLIVATNAAVSNSGQYMVMYSSSETVGKYYYSDDYGSTWTQKTVAGLTVAFSSISIDEA